MRNWYDMGIKYVQLHCIYSVEYLLCLKYQLVFQFPSNCWSAVSRKQLLRGWLLANSETRPYLQGHFTCILTYPATITLLFFISNLAAIIHLLQFKLDESAIKLNVRYYRICRLNLENVAKLARSSVSILCHACFHLSVTKAIPCTWNAIVISECLYFDVKSRVVFQGTLLIYHRYICHLHKNDTWI